MLKDAYRVIFVDFPVFLYSDGGGTAGPVDGIPLIYWVVYVCS
jgi:hypothetical protein